MLTPTSQCISPLTFPFGNYKFVFEICESVSDLHIFEAENKGIFSFIKIFSDSHVWLFVTPDCNPSGSLCLWDSLGKNTGVGYHVLL